MAYEYEESNKQIIYTVDNESSMDKLNERINELQEVYRKAKAFDAIVNIQDDFVEYHGFYPCVEEYAEEVEDIIIEYTEDK